MDGDSSSDKDNLERLPTEEDATPSSKPGASELESSSELEASPSKERDENAKPDAAETETSHAAGISPDGAVASNATASSSGATERTMMAGESIDMDRDVALATLKRDAQAKARAKMEAEEARRSAPSHPGASSVGGAGDDAQQGDSQHTRVQRIVGSGGPSDHAVGASAASEDAVAVSTKLDARPTSRATSPGAVAVPGATSKAMVAKGSKFDSSADSNEFEGEIASTDQCNSSRMAGTSTAPGAFAFDGAAGDASAAKIDGGARTQRIVVPKGPSDCALHVAERADTKTENIPAATSTKIDEKTTFSRATSPAAVSVPRDTVEAKSTAASAATAASDHSDEVKEPHVTRRTDRATAPGAMAVTGPAGSGTKRDVPEPSGNSAGRVQRVISPNDPSDLALDVSTEGGGRNESPATGTSSSGKTDAARLASRAASPGAVAISGPTKRTDEGALKLARDVSGSSLLVGSLSTDDDADAVAVDVAIGDASGLVPSEGDSRMQQVVHPKGPSDLALDVHHETNLNNEMVGSKLSSACTPGAALTASESGKKQASSRPASASGAVPVAATAAMAAASAATRGEDCAELPSEKVAMIPDNPATTPRIEDPEIHGSTGQHQLSKSEKENGPPQQVAVVGLSDEIVNGGIATSNEGQVSNLSIASHNLSQAPIALEESQHNHEVEAHAGEFVESELPPATNGAEAAVATTAARGGGPPSYDQEAALPHSRDDAPFVADAVAIPDDLYAEDIQPYVPDEVIEEEHKRRFIKRGILIAVLAVCIIVPVVTVLVVVVFPKPGGGESVSDASEPTGAPSMAPSSFRLASISNFLVNNAISSEQQLRNASSPQYQALHWISDEDGMQADMDDPTFGQRYSSAVFYYATAGDNWSRCYQGDIPTHCDGTPWLDQSSECTWYGVRCDDTSMITTVSLGATGEGLNLNGYLPSEMTHFVELRDLILPTNSLKGPLPEWIGELRNLEEVWLYDNEFSGALPDSLYSLSKLRLITLNENKFTGTISSSIGQLTVLDTLNFGINSFSGSIPAAVSDMTSLRFLRLYENMLNSTLPENLYQMSRLERVIIDGNKFSGTIAPAVGQLTNLEGFNIRNNTFSSTIPEEFGSLTRLEQLHLSQNDLSGQMPQSVCALTPNPLAELSADCGGSSPQVECLSGCCTECFTD